jgi:hypothetical protein
MLPVGPANDHCKSTPIFTLFEEVYVVVLAAQRTFILSLKSPGAVVLGFYHYYAMSR